MATSDLQNVLLRMCVLLRRRRHKILQRGFGCFDVLGKRHKFVEGKQVNVFMIHIIYA